MIKLLIIKKNREIMLNRAKEYHKNNNERLREEAKNKYLKRIN